MYCNVDVYLVSLKLNSQSVTGSISICFDEKWFPSRQWGDFPVRLLGLWIDVVLGVSDAGDTSLTFAFMDGPYEIGFDRVSDDNWIACFRENCIATTLVEPIGNVSLRALSKNLVTVARATILRCEEMGWQAVDGLVFLKKVTEELATRL